MKVLSNGLGEDKEKEKKTQTKRINSGREKVLKNGEGEKGSSGGKNQSAVMKVSDFASNRKKT